MDKNEILTKMRDYETTINNLIATTSAEQLTQTRGEDGWSLKDVLAHMAAWQELCASWIDMVMRGETPPQTTTFSDETINQMNENFYDTNKNRPLNEVIGFFRQSHEQLLNVVNALTDDDINEPNRFAWRAGRPLLAFIAGNSFGHFEEHADSLRGRMDKSRVS